MLTLFLLSTVIVNRMSGSSFVISKSVFNGTAALPDSSRLEGTSTWIVISRSVHFKALFSSVASTKTQPSIGKVVRVGVAFDSFCSAF